MTVYEYSKKAGNGIHHAHICANAKAISDSKSLTYVQFNVWYYDFEYNDKRVKTFSRVEDATQFICALVNDYKYRFINVESVY
mgnify:CR=1 FL=1